MKYLLTASLIINGIFVILVSLFGFLFISHRVGFLGTQATGEQVKTLTVDVNKTYTFPLTKGARTSPLSLTILSVQKTQKIIVGQKALTTKNKKSFLVVNTIIVNKGTTQIQASSTDYIRLVKNSALLEPTYKALTGTIAANNSYASGMVFLIDDAEKSFTFSIGDNVGMPTTVPVSF